MDTLEYLFQRFNLKPDLRNRPLEIKGITRAAMGPVLRELGFKVGAEVGVMQGRHAEWLCQGNPDMKLYAVDLWDGYMGYQEKGRGRRLREALSEAHERLDRFDVEFVQKPSVEAARAFADNSLDFVFIDAAHDFENVAVDLCEWSRKVRVGGIVFGHDYNQQPFKLTSHELYAVRHVVQCFVYVHNIHPLFVLKNDLPKPGSDSESWLFVRDPSDRIQWHSVPNLYYPERETA